MCSSTQQSRVLAGTYLRVLDYRPATLNALPKTTSPLCPEPYLACHFPSLSDVCCVLLLLPPFCRDPSPSPVGRDHVHDSCSTGAAISMSAAHPAAPALAEVAGTTADDDSGSPQRPESSGTGGGAEAEVAAEVGGSSQEEAEAGGSAEAVAEEEGAMGRHL